MHRFHPDRSREDQSDAVLWDECASCERHARNLGVTLDERNWVAMWRRMIAVEWGGGQGTEHYRSGNEATLGRDMYMMAIALERYANVDPKTLV